MTSTIGRRPPLELYAYLIGVTSLLPVCLFFFSHIAYNFGSGALWELDVRAQIATADN